MVVLPAAQEGAASAGQTFLPRAIRSRLEPLPQRSCSHSPPLAEKDGQIRGRVGESRIMRAKPPGERR
jgi:hypothetical protein